MKETKINRQIFVIVLIVLMIIVIGLATYFFQFRNQNLASESTNWGDFGGYLAGLTGFANLLVFIVLTIYVARLSDKNSKIQVSTQKNLILAQFRQNEIMKLDSSLNKVLDNRYNETKYDIISKHNHASFALIELLNQGQHLFPILQDENLRNKINELAKKYNELADMAEKFYDQPNDEIEEKYNDEIATKIQFVVHRKNEIIEDLQRFLINEMD